MLQQKHDVKKLASLERDLTKTVDSFDIDDEKAKNYESPNKLLVDLAENDKQKYAISEYLEFTQANLSSVPIKEFVKFSLMYFHRVMLLANNEDYELEQAGLSFFIEDTSSVLINPLVENVIKFNEQYKDDYNNLYGEIEDTEWFKILNEADYKLTPVFDKLKSEILNGKYHFIESIDFELFKNKLILYYVYDYYRPSIEPLLEKVVSEMEKRIDAFTDENFIMQSELIGVDISEKRRELFKTDKINEHTGINETDSLILMKSNLNLLKNLSSEFLFNDIDSVITLKESNEIGLTNMLYNLFLETHSNHSLYPFYTYREWFDEQDREGNTPNNRKWKNYKHRRILNIIPAINEL